MLGLKAILLTLVLTFLIAPCHFNVIAEEPIATKSISDKILSLQQQRIELIQKEVDVAKVQYEQGRVPLVVYHSPQLKLLDAQFDLAKTDKEKIEILQAKLEIAKLQAKLEISKLQAKLEIANKIFRSIDPRVGGEGGRLSEVKSNALEAELQLLKFQSMIQGNDSDGKIQELQTQRIKALQKSVDGYKVLYKQGKVPFVAYHSAQLKLSNAQLGLAKTDKEKAEIFQAKLEIAKKVLSRVEALSNYRVGGGEASVLFEARSNALEAELQLLKFQQMIKGSTVNQGDRSVGKIQELQTQRIKALQKFVDRYKVLYEQGKVPFVAYQSAQQKLLNAQFEIAKTNKEKIELIQVQLDIAKEMAIRIKQLHDKGFLVGRERANLEKSQVFVVQLEIQLLKLQQLDE